MENLGWKMLSRISNLGGGKFGVENAISNLQFLGWKNWGGKCCLESRIWGVENLGWKILSRISNFWGGKCYLESPIFGVENLGWKVLSRISNLGGGVENLGWKMLSRNF